MNINLANIDFIPGQGGGGLTPEQESAIDVIVNAGDGFLKHTPSVPIIGARRAEILIEGFRNQELSKINGDVYLHHTNDGILYKFNRYKYQFEKGPQTTENPTYEHLWADSQGRVYSNNTYLVDLETGQYEYKDMGGDFLIHTGSNITNIIEKDGVVYMISYNNACAYIFNEETQSFDSSIPVQGKFPSSTFYRHFSEFEGHWINDVGKEQTELVFHLDEAEPYAEWVTLPERLFPGAWSYEYEGQVIKETTRAEFVHPVVKNGVTEYYNWGYKNPVMYKLVNGAWEIVPFTMDVPNYQSHIAGVSIDDIWLGYGYMSNYMTIIIWNFGPDKSIPESYEWTQPDLTPYATMEWVQQDYATIYLVNTSIDNTKEWVKQKYVYDPYSLIDLTGYMPLIDGKQIANIDMCITNNTSYPGPYIEGIEDTSIEKGYYFYFVTPSGRLIYTNPHNSVAMEFNGTQWVNLQSVTNFIQWDKLIELNDGLYAISASNSLYKWDDTNSDWVFIIETPNSEIWAANSNTLRCSSNYKLVNNDGTYQWVEDEVVNYPGDGVSIKLGQNYYYINYIYNLYSYNENEKVFTIINSLNQPITNHYFTYDGCLYYFAGDPDSPIIRKVNPSIDNYYDIKTDIYISNVYYVYAVYDNKLWTYGDERFGYTYSKSTPAVPASDGTYTLKAVRVGDQITYNWVLDA